mgnify:CR=1 FL=1
MFLYEMELNLYALGKENFCLEPEVLSVCLDASKLIELLRRASVILGQFILFLMK